MRLNEQEVDLLWNTHVGSRKMFWTDQLKRLNELRNKRTLPFYQIYCLYLSSTYWRAIRAQVIARDGYKCVKCGAVDRLHVNHKRYHPFGKEVLSDLETLCEACHAAVTKKYDLTANMDLRGRPVSVDGPLCLALRRGR